MERRAIICSSFFMYKWILGSGIRRTNDYHCNLRGDVVTITNQDKEVVATYEYDAWGNVVKSDTKGIAVDNPFGYAGYMYDKEIGMYYLIARYYNPEHGVFLSVDPDPGDEDDPVTMNGYTYGDNNPVMMINPDGHLAWFIPVAVHEARIAAPHVGRFVGKQLAKRAITQPLKYKNTKAVAGKIIGYTKHGFNQAISRNNGLGVSPKAILHTVKSGKMVIQKDRGTIKYTSKQAVVVLNKRGKIVTTFARGTKYTRKGKNKRE
ncbi:wall-associated domain protein [Bacillus anthracis str. CDC 684]|nr:wall-associated domain protein [Bacillus anthracis str. CDC 684]EDT65985.1 wall-associated domain protein [Bacillus anthracis str. A0174]